MRAPRRLLLVTALWLVALSARTAAAQCPDGTPPPCKGAGGPARAALARRVNPPLDTRAWIVVPFSNAMRAPELDWLRDASVNLLAMDLARWTDIRVVDDKRVGDLLREVPAARATAPLTLADGMAIARRAGAGMLVMGDFFRVGRGARLVANVFDVKTGARLRSVTQQATEPDSLLGAFTPLARGVLAVPPPPDARLGAIGTSRMDAYQAYLLGVRALNRLDTRQAVAQFTLALSLDSTFALAHYKLSRALTWGDLDRDLGPERAHAAAAARLGASLPARERALIAGRLAEANLDWGRACETYAGLVARDSSDVEALYGLGECNFHDAVLVTPPGDTLHGAFRSSWNTSLRALRRVIEVDPTFHLAFSHILDILSARARFGCVTPGARNECASWTALALRDGDSLVTVPTHDSASYDAQYHRWEVEHPFAANMRDARRIAQAWVDADTTEDVAHYYLAEVFARTGELEDAWKQARLVSTTRNAFIGKQVLFQRFELAIKLGRGRDARALLDTITPDFPPDSMSLALGSTEATFGRFGRILPYRRVGARFDRGLVTRYYANVPRVMLGLPRDSLNLDERAYSASRAGPSCDANCQRIAIYPTLMFGARAPRSWWPQYPPKVADIRMSVSRAIAVGDTANLRASARTLDSLAHVRQGMVDYEAGTSIIAADGYLALRDSAAALRMARFYTDSVMPPMPWTQASGMDVPTTPLLWVRMMLLRADLSAAAGSRFEALTWYKRVLSLWETADPELQPTIARIRAAVAALEPKA